MEMTLKLLIAGFILSLFGIVVAFSFQFIENHSWYWSSAHIFSVATMLLTLLGGFLMGRSRYRSGERKLWAIITGCVFIISWTGIAITAFSLTFLGMNYFSGSEYVGWNTYYGDYLVGFLHVRLLQFAAVAGLFTGFLVGFGYLPRKLPSCRYIETSICRR